VVVVTPTASGKTLCYNLPALQALVHQPDARVLYLFPTKALAQDQLAELEALARQLPRCGCSPTTANTPQDAAAPCGPARTWFSRIGHAPLRNPSAPHEVGDLFQNLRYVVIDELHAYRGVFGSHLANVLRRLRRICRHYGSAPQFIMASATIANPGELARRLTASRSRRSRRADSDGRQGLRLLQPAGRQSRARDPAPPYLGEAAKLAIRSSGRRSRPSSSPRAGSPPRSC